MAHFAKIDENNVVETVNVIRNADCGGGNYPESEAIGQKFLADNGFEGRWLQTSYNNNFRGRFAGIGFIYDPDLDVFMSPQPFPSWTLNRETYAWEPPVPVPDTQYQYYSWNEESQQWDKNEVEMPPPEECADCNIDSESSQNLEEGQNG